MGFVKYSLSMYSYKICVRNVGQGEKPVLFEREIARHKHVIKRYGNVLCSTCCNESVSKTILRL